MTRWCSSRTSAAHDAAAAGLPATLRRADLIVSLPKLKTHHWVGVTLSLKNFFGVMPGIVYGWPKNVLHHAGIGRSILDITAAVRPHLAIVDGIVGMEGDGPIMGTPRRPGVLVMGTNLPAVDATCARLMQIDPWRVGYLAAASSRLGPIARAATSHSEARRSPGCPSRFNCSTARGWPVCGLERSGRSRRSQPLVPGPSYRIESRRRRNTRLEPTVGYSGDSGRPTNLIDNGNYWSDTQDRPSSESAGRRIRI